MSKTSTEGLTRLHLDLSVTAAQLATWDPDRIAAFFDGVARAQGAISGDIGSTLRHEHDILREYAGLALDDIEDCDKCMRKDGVIGLNSLTRYPAPVDDAVNALKSALGRSNDEQA